MGDKLTSKIIAICGHEHSGKSTTAKFIASALDRRGYSTKIISFSTPLKQICSTYFNVDKSNRNALEELAMDMRRILGNDIFTNATFSEIHLSNYDFYIIDDLRYSHEFIKLSESEYLVYLLKTRNIETRDMDSARLEELLSHVDLDIVTFLPEDYDHLYKYIEEFVELVI